MNHEETIKVEQVIQGTAAVSSEDGNLLYEKLLSNLSISVETYIDFENIVYLNTAFLNAAVGQLYAKYTREELNKNLHVLNLSDTDLKLFKKVTQRAREFYENRDSTSESLNDFINE